MSGAVISESRHFISYMRVGCSAEFPRMNLGGDCGSSPMVCGRYVKVYHLGPLIYKSISLPQWQICYIISIMDKNITKHIKPVRLAEVPSEIRQELRQAR